MVQLIPIFVLVIALMGSINYFFRPRRITKYVGEGSGWKGWLIAGGAGILSHGPIYVWFPLLRELREKGMRDGLVAAFLYNRAVKLPLFPMLIYYFGLLFALLLLAFTVVASVIEGMLIEVFLGRSRDAG